MLPDADLSDLGAEDCLDDEIILLLDPWPYMKVNIQMIAILT